MCYKMTKIKKKKKLIVQRLLNKNQTIILFKCQCIKNNNKQQLNTC